MEYKSKYKLTHKEFGFYEELTDFVNKNNIKKTDICDIVYNVRNNIVLFYWKPDK